VPGGTDHSGDLHLNELPQAVTGQLEVQLTSSVFIQWRC
jgi:hypothetical protein